MAERVFNPFTGELDSIGINTESGTPSNGDLAQFNSTTGLWEFITLSLTEDQIEFNEDGGHNHDGTDNNGSIIRTDAPLTDTDEATKVFIKYYGFKLSISVWQIAEVDLRSNVVLYSLSENNLSSYEISWNNRTSLTYSTWSAV